eukprot:TRINITY_DN2708_c0_g1_i1.p1 TRINITY_DN2708_c0_g1~~TRINITY_DN2708_c0_g1_i1.p1  ORF type:complete len:747 (-),score=183.64 TRINITY_DN2708_c0_g1_i1:725-2965(-)
MELTSLVVLKLAQNYISDKYTPDTAFSKLYNLQELSLSGNQFFSLPFKKSILNLAVKGRLTLITIMRNYLDLSDLYQFIQDVKNAGCSVGYFAQLIPQSVLEDKSLYIGGVESAENVKYLVKHGINNILSLGEMPFGADDVVLEGQRSYPKNFNHLFVDIEDMASTDILVHFNRALAFIDEAVHRSESVLVHCAAGISRSASFVIAYLIDKHNMDFDTAFACVHRARCCVQPNPGFVEQLKKFEQMKLAEVTSHTEDIDELTDDSSGRTQTADGLDSMIPQTTTTTAIIPTTTTTSENSATTSSNSTLRRTEEELRRNTLEAQEELIRLEKQEEAEKVAEDRAFYRTLSRSRIASMHVKHVPELQVALLTGHGQAVVNSGAEKNLIGPRVVTKDTIFSAASHQHQKQHRVNNEDEDTDTTLTTDSECSLPPTPKPKSPKQQQHLPVANNTNNVTSHSNAESPVLKKKKRDKREKKKKKEKEPKRLAQTPRGVVSNSNRKPKKPKEKESTSPGHSSGSRRRDRSNSNTNSNSNSSSSNSNSTNKKPGRSRSIGAPDEIADIIAAHEWQQKRASAVASNSIPSHTSERSLLSPPHHHHSRHTSIDNTLNNGNFNRHNSYDNSDITQRKSARRKAAKKQLKLADKQNKKKTKKKRKRKRQQLSPTHTLIMTTTTHTRRTCRWRCGVTCSCTCRYRNCTHRISLSTMPHFTCLLLLNTMRTTGHNGAEPTSHKTTVTTHTTTTPRYLITA